MKDIIAHLKLRIGEATDWGNKPDCDKVLITTSEASAIVEALEGKVWIEEAAEFKQEDFDKLIPDPSISNMNSPYQKLFDYMYDEHGVTLLQTDMQEIIRIVNEMDNWISVEDRFYYFVIMKFVKGF